LKSCSTRSGNALPLRRCRSGSRLPPCRLEQRESSILANLPLPSGESRSVHALPSRAKQLLCQIGAWGAKDLRGGADMHAIESQQRDDYVN
jgi:hypothetical protein